MHIRATTRDDIPMIAEIASAAFRDDNLFSIFFPPVASNSSAFYRKNLLRVRKRFVDIGTRSFVAESDDTDEFWTGKSGILGYSFWTRNGKSDVARKWQADCFSMSTDLPNMTS
jgi:hypothetical protein